MSRPRISFYTQGCRLNQSETAVLEEQFKALGFAIVEFHHPSDVVVVNTCTVTENGDADTRRLVNRINRENPQSKIALVGCQSQILKEKLLQLKSVKWVIGNQEKDNIPHIISSTLTQDSPVLEVKKIQRDPFKIDTTGLDRHHKRANIKVQDGCDFYCSFCTIPFARGPARSRDFDNCIDEVKKLTEGGHKEIIVTGINVGTYSHEGKTFSDLIKAFLDIDTLDRLRISSIEPTTIPVELILKMSQHPKFCRHLHIPLQSGTDDILQGMKRKYGIKEFQDFINFAYNTIPDICIGTDVIVGFPGETADLFEQTYAYLEQAPLHYFHVFSYSERTMARSKKLDDQVLKEEIASRSERLRKLSNRKKKTFLQLQLGKTLKVLVEQQKGEYWVGTTDNYIKVYIKSNDPLNGTIDQMSTKQIATQGSNELSNQLIPVKLMDLYKDGVRATLC